MLRSAPHPLLTLAEALDAAAEAGALGGLAGLSLAAAPLQPACALLQRRASLAAARLHAPRGWLPGQRPVRRPRPSGAG